MNGKGGSRRYWPNESGWTCEQCEPPTLKIMIRAELDERVQRDNVRFTM